MSNNWIELSVNTTTIVSELLSAFLQENGAKGVVLGDWSPEAVSEYTTLKAYFPEDTKDIEQLSEMIQLKFSDYTNAGLNTGSKEISVKQVSEDQWANSWKQYFHTFRLGKNLVIKPLWDEYQAKEGDIIINFDPGMAFGTGSHPSTHLCIEELELIAEEIKNKDSYKILDLGTGSGILAMTASLLGFKNITAIDNDPVAVKVSKENFALNHLDIRLSEGELKNCEQQYDLILGNLLAHIIESIAEQLFAKTVSGGMFMGSGIIVQKEADVIKKLTEAGFVLKRKKYMIDRWVMLLFEKP